MFSFPLTGEAVLLIRAGNASIDTERPPSLAQLGVSQDIVAVAEELSGLFEQHGIERHSLELILRATIYLDRQTLRG